MSEMNPTDIILPPDSPIEKTVEPVKLDDIKAEPPEELDKVEPLGVAVIKNEVPELHYFDKPGCSRWSDSLATGSSLKPREEVPNVESGDILSLIKSEPPEQESLSSEGNNILCQNEKMSSSIKLEPGDIEMKTEEELKHEELMLDDDGSSGYDSDLSVKFNNTINDYQKMEDITNDGVYIPLEKEFRGFDGSESTYWLHKSNCYSNHGFSNQTTTDDPLDEEELPNNKEKQKETCCSSISNNSNKNKDYFSDSSKNEDSDKYKTLKSRKKVSQKETLIENASTVAIVKELVKDYSSRTSGIKPSDSTPKREPHFCFYCEKKVSNFARHCVRHHSKERDVAKVLVLPIKSIERKRLFNDLRKKGNFLAVGFNCFKPIRKGLGREKVLCDNCLGYYSPTRLRRHKKQCTKVKSNDQKAIYLNRVAYLKIDQKLKVQVSDSSKENLDKYQTLKSRKKVNKKQIPNENARSTAIVKELVKDYSLTKFDVKSTKTTPKRKPNFCFYCKKKVSNFARHCVRHHSKERDVAKILVLPIKSIKRKRLFNDLRKKGNFLAVGFNCFKPIRKGLGREKVLCDNCLGYYSPTMLRRHKKQCIKVKSNDQKAIYLNRVAYLKIDQKLKVQVSDSSKEQNLDKCLKSRKKVNKKQIPNENAPSAAIVKELVKDYSLGMFDVNSTKTRPKRKPNFCFYCRKKVSNFARHCVRHHSKERDVAKILVLPIKSIKRKRLFNDLRKKGFNCFKSVRKSYVRGKEKVPCDNCLGYYSPKMLRRHKKQCFKVNSNAQEAIHLNKIAYLEVDPILKVQDENLEKYETVKSRKKVNKQKIPNENAPTAAIVKGLVKDYSLSTSGVQSTKTRPTREPDFCFYCKKKILTFSRHIIRHHSKERDVAKILVLPIKSIQRKQLFNDLRKKGNFLADGYNYFKPVRKSYVPGREQVFCYNCLGYYSSKQLRRHKKKCIEQKSNAQESIDLNMMAYLKVDPRLKEQVFPQMRPDKISFEAKRDPLICEYGSRYLKTYKKQHFANITSRKMRELSKVLLELKQLDTSITTLISALKPTNYDILVEAIKRIGKCDSAKDVNISLTFSMNIVRSLKECCDIAISFIHSKNKNHSVSMAIAEEELKALIRIFETNWNFNLPSQKEENQIKEKDDETFAKLDNKNKRILIPWMKKQKELALEYFSNHIKEKRPPKRHECNELRTKYPEIFKNKDWLKIKVFVQNAYTKNRSTAIDEAEQKALIPNFKTNQNFVISSFEEEKTKKTKRLLVPWIKVQKELALEYFGNHIKEKRPPKRHECNELRAKYPEIFKNKDWLKIKVFIQNAYTKNSSTAIDEAEQKALIPDFETNQNFVISSFEEEETKKTKRLLVPWIKEQKELVLEYFSNHIKEKRPPKRHECNELRTKYPEIFDNKDWLKIKVFVQNAYSKNANQFCLI